MTDQDQKPELPLGSAGYSDSAFLEAMATCTVPENGFHHADHLRLGWILLHGMGLEAAIDEMRKLLRAFAASLGKADRYHETITQAWLKLLASHCEGSFEEFLALHAQRARSNLLQEFWTPEALGSTEARRQWVAPDKRALPGLQP